ncbi:MAG: HEPN domain-containing protein [Chloroflexota bacterium]
MIDVAHVFLTKAGESLAGAESELANGRYNNCANRCYYACFQAAIAALVREKIDPSGSQGRWGHAVVQSEFVRQLIQRRKVYPGELRDVLARCLSLRQQGDYSVIPVAETMASRALRRARQFVEAVQARGSESR